MGNRRTMRVVIVGASGNVGTALLRRLSGMAEVDDVVGVARRVPPAGPPYSQARWVSCDIGDPDAASKLVDVFAGAAAVVHLAWQIQPSQQPRRLQRSNVHGSRVVAEAAVRAGVPALVYASSIGAYAPGPPERRVDEHWPVEGIPGSVYSQQKVAVERILDRVERENPALRVVRLRPALIFQREAGAQIQRYFLGSLVPASLLRSRRLPVVPLPRGIRTQCVHADDVAQAYAQAVVSDVRGAFNVATEPVLDGDLIAQVLGGRRIPVPWSVLSLVAGASWILRLQPTDPGWVWLAHHAPLLDTTRARTELGWTPQYDAQTALAKLIDGLATGVGTASPALRERDGLAVRAGQLVRGRLPGHGSRY
jgi:nucleoside-diphosphate-sugar epimerase